MSSTTWTFSQQFLTDFQASRSDLESRADLAKSASPPADVIQALSLELAKLTKGLVDATGSLPSYDQRQCELQLKGLERTLDELRTASAPRPRFSFKRNEKSVEPKPLSPTPAPETKPASTTTTVSTSTPLRTANLSLSLRSQCYLTLESLPKSVFVSHDFDLTISDLDGCIVNLLPGSSNQPSLASRNLAVSALHIQKLSNTILLLPDINGSVLLRGLSRCVVVVGCHQFRMHTSKNVDVYVSIPSDPVIEHASNIRFAAYPHTLSTGQSTKQSKSFAVQDFSHIRSNSSPNWSIVPDDEVTRDWPESEITGEEFAVALQRLLPGSTTHRKTDTPHS